MHSDEDPAQRKGEKKKPYYPISIITGKSLRLLSVLLLLLFYTVPVVTVIIIIIFLVDEKISGKVRIERDWVL